MAKLNRLQDFVNKDLVAATMTLGEAGVEAQKELDAAVNTMKKDFQTHVRTKVLQTQEEGDSAAASAADSVNAAGTEMSKQITSAKNKLSELQTSISEDNTALQEYSKQLNDTSDSLLLTKNMALTQIAGYKNASDDAVDAVLGTVDLKLDEARGALE